VIGGVHYVRKARKVGPPFWYVYAYRGGPQIARHEGWDRPKLNASDIRRLLDAQEALVKRVDTTLGSLVRMWRPSSPDWMSLADNTKKTWGSALDRIDEKWGQTPLSIWSDTRMVAKVLDWRDSRAETPRGADIGVTVLRALLEFGRLRGKVSINVANGIPKLYKNGARAEIIWLDQDMERFRAACEELSTLHIADGMRLAALTGLRRADLVTLKWSEVHEHAIQKRAAKISKGKRRFARIPRVPELDMLLDELKHRYRKPGVDNVLVNSRGAAWSGDGFGTSFNRIRDYAKIVHVDPETGKSTAKHVHDLRGTFCTKLIKSGLTDQETAGIMGWSPEQVAGIRQTYVDQTAVIVAIGKRIRQAL
jgi:integrase